MGRGDFDLPDSLILLIIVSVIAAVGVMLLNTIAETSLFSEPFRNTASTLLNSTGTALVLGIGAVGTVVSYLVWLAGSGQGR